MFPFNFKNKELEKKALTLAVGRKSALYERLEFLGDSVLSIIVSEYLYVNYKNLPDVYDFVDSRISG